MAGKVDFLLDGDATKLVSVIAEAFKSGGLRGAQELESALTGKPIEFKTKLVVEDNQIKSELLAVTPIANKVNKALSEGARIQAGSLTSLRQQVNRAKQLRDEISKFEGGTDRYGRSVLKINKSWEDQNKKVELLQRQLTIASSNGFFDRVKNALNLDGFNRFGQGVTQLVNTFQSLSIIVQQTLGAFNLFTNAARNIQAIELTFQSIGVGALGASQALEESSRIALSLGADLNSVRTGFQKLSPVILASGGNLDDVGKIVEALSSRFAAFGKSADESKRIMNAVVQAFGKGKLMSEELNQQISEADPAFRTDLASAIGVSVSKLNEMVKAGEITNDVMIKTLPLLAKSSVLYSKLGNSATEAASKVNTFGVTINQVQNYIATVNQLSLERAANKMAPLIEIGFRLQAAFADFFKVLTESSAFKVFVDILALFGDSIVKIIEAILKLLTVILQILEPLAQLLKILTENKAIMSILATIIAVALGGKLLLMGRAAFVAAGQLKALAVAGLAGKASFGQITAGVAKFGQTVTSNSRLLPSITQFLTGFAGKAKTGELAAVSLSSSIRGLGSSIAQVAKNPALIGRAVAESLGRFGPLINSAKTGFSSLIFATKQGAITTAAWGNALVKSFAPVTRGGGLQAATAAYKTLNAQTIRYTGEVLKAGTSMTSFSARTVAAQRALAGLGTGGTGVVQVIGKLVTPAVIGRFILWEAAIRSVGGAINNWSVGVAASNAVTEKWSKQVDAASKASLTLKDVYKASGTGVGEFAAQIVNTTARTTAWAQVLEAVTGTLTGTRGTVNQVTLESASWSKETATLSENLDKLNVINSKNIADFKLYAATAEKGEATTGALTNASKQLVTGLDAELQALKAQLTAREQETTKSKAAQEQKEIQLALIRGEITQRELLRKEIIAVAAANGVDVTAMDNELSKRQQVIDKLKEQLEAIKKVNEEKIKEIESKRDSEIEQTKKTNDEAVRGLETQIEAIERVRSATEKRWSAEDSARSRSQTLSARAYDDEMRRIDRVRDAITKAYEARITALRGPTPAESQLRAMEVNELRKQASNAETQEERLRAQAQLERMEREKQIARLEEEREKKLEQLEAERTAKEEKRREQQRTEEDEQWKREQERQGTRDGWDAKIQTARETIKKIQKETEDSEKAIAEKYAPEINKLKQEILDKEKEIKKEEDAKEARLQQLIRIGEGFMKQKERELEIEREIARLKGQKPATNSTTNTSSGAGTTGGRQTNQRGGGRAPNEFLGGPVLGGKLYTVNEFGQESFLSKSGKLSMINAPAWGTWRPPSAGTIIPAHITAGLDIPSVGSPSVAPAAARSGVMSRRGDPLLKALSAALGAPQGRVTNNVTIQSDNTTKAASDILVELTKIKRNRYR